MAIKVRVLVAGACLLTLAGCQNGTTGASGPAAVTPAATVSAGAPSGAATTAATPTPAPTKTLVSKVPTTASPTAPKTLTPPPTAVKTLTPVPLPCKTSQLNVLDDENQGAAGTLVEEFSMHNTSSTTCRIIGRPSISPYGMQAQGSGKVEANLDVTVNPIPSSDSQIGDPATTVTLTHGDYAIFFVKWSHVPTGSGSGSCDDADGFDFQAPSDSIQKLITFAFTICGGEVQVSNVFAKTNGF